MTTNLRQHVLSINQSIIISIIIIIVISVCIDIDIIIHKTIIINNNKSSVVEVRCSLLFLPLGLLSAAGNGDVTLLRLRLLQRL